MKLTENLDFFKKKLLSTTQEINNIKQNAAELAETKKHHTAQTSASVAKLVKETADILAKAGLKAMSKRVENILNDAARDRFVISVVGEFSRGKSTFLNNLLNNAAHLPTGDLPTTAIMTRIRYAKLSKMAVFDEKGTRVAMLDVVPESWKGLVANNFSENQPRGSVIVGVPDRWLGMNGIEIIDCPGAGDLSDERTKQIADTLDRTDGAIINISATSPFSLTEKEFILQRILKRKTPFSLVIINKLDLIPFEERNDIVQHIKNMLELNGMNIPVYIPADIEMPDNTFDEIKGLDKIKAAIEQWANDPKRQALTEEWIKARVLDVVFMAISTLEEQQKLYDIDSKKYEEVIQHKKDALNKLELLWGELENDFLKKANTCYEAMLAKVKEDTGSIVERLQYEANHASSPEKWWNEDYPYRLKIELANLAVSLDNTISRIIISDTRWFNQILDQKFKNYVQIGDSTIAQKSDFITEKTTKELEFSNLTRMQNISRLGTTALCIGSYFTPLGFIGSMGFGTAGCILQSKFFKKKLEEQQAMLKQAIATDVPQIIEKATIKSESKILAIYDSILKESEKKKELWKEAQDICIENEKKPDSCEQSANVKTQLTELNNIIAKLN